MEISVHGGYMMSNLKHYIEGIKNGEGFFDEAFKLHFFLNALCIIKAIYAILFFSFDLRYQGLLSVVFAVSYQLLRLLIQKGSYKAIIHIVYVEVWCFAAVNEVILGRESSFSMLAVASIPAIFYFALTWGIYKKKEISSFFLSLAPIFVFTALYV